MSDISSTPNGEISGHIRWAVMKVTEHDNKFCKIEEDITRLRVEVGKLQVKSGMYGAVAGAIVALAAILLKVK